MVEGFERKEAVACGSLLRKIAMKVTKVMFDVP
jgi:hypothetical protein